MPEFDLKIFFEPQDFTQVNPQVNQAMVSQAVDLLAPAPGREIVDLFCGVGNFSLALARRGARVIGMEGELALVHRAQANAQCNDLSSNTEFLCIDLYDPRQASQAATRCSGKVLIDPPRGGAQSICEALIDGPSESVLYVSCNPATLARDAEILVHGGGYRLCAAGLIDMFPHTAHAEAMALFQRSVAGSAFGN